METPSNMLLPYFDAGYPVVAVETVEEQRLIVDCVARMTESKGTWNKVLYIAATGGLQNVRGERSQAIDTSAGFSKAFGVIAREKETLLIVSDFQHVINAAMNYRTLLQVLPACKAEGCMIVLLSPAWQLPAELKHEVPVLRMSLPSPEELEDPLNVVLEGAKEKLEGEHRAELISSARGLTLAEAENVFALSSSNGYSKELVEQEKMRLVRSAYMSVEKPAPASVLGGLQLFKDYITQEVLPVRHDEDLRVRGILSVGVPGSGKSLGSKVISSILGWPLVRMDISAAKGSLVGVSEANVRNGLALADAIAPCVLWFDEIEKAVGGFSTNSDSGVTLGIVGTILTWMQEHSSPVLVMATCNDFSKLPAELTRHGRFDERFFFDLPTPVEREQIARIHLKRLRCAEEHAKFIADMTDQWTGAEIEQLIKSAARRTMRELTVGSLTESKEAIIPIAKTTQIQQLREWAKNHLRAANTPEVQETGRKVKRHGNVN